MARKVPLMGALAITGMRCVICGRVLSPDTTGFVCPDHGDEGILDVEYDYAAINAAVSREDIAKGPQNQWRYAPLLPVSTLDSAPPLRVGWTPLYHAPRLAQNLDNLVGAIWVKDETCQPTGSLKDRASSIAVIKAAEAGAEIITTASTGNAAAALAGMCASVGRPCVIFVPQSAPRAKIAQLLAYGARVFLVQGTYDDAFDLCMTAAREFGWYNRNTGYNPYMAEGKKTAAFEICEQLGWRAPDQVYVGVGDGCIISGLYKGFKDLLGLGWIDRIPRLMGVQAEGSDFFCRVVEQNLDPLTAPALEAKTAADSISAAMPRDRLKALAAIRESGGAWLRVTDDEILAAIPRLAQGSGVFAEPAGAACLAGLVKSTQLGLTNSETSIVLVATGNGLKDIAAATKAVEKIATSHTIPPDINALRSVLSSSGA